LPDGWKDPLLKTFAHPDFYESFCNAMDLLDGALPPFDLVRFLRGELSPLTFGSAKNNWGVDLFLEIFAKYSPGPQARTSQGEMVEAQTSNFSGFVFKIQANMDRKHRDRVAFLRVVSGKFERGMKVSHSRLAKEIRLAYANQFLAQDRETVDEAYAGDIVGINDTGNFRIGDTVYTGKRVEFDSIPRFSPELFGRLKIKDALKRQTLQKAVSQLVEEGTVQLFFDPLVGKQDAILGVVGQLQFDVLLFRLNDEYKLDVKLENLAYQLARWPVDKSGKPFLGDLKGPSQLRVFRDVFEHPVVLLEREWDLGFLKEKNPDVEFLISI